MSLCYAYNARLGIQARFQVFGFSMVHGSVQADTRAERYGEQIHYDKK